MEIIGGVLRKIRLASVAALFLAVAISSAEAGSAAIGSVHSAARAPGAAVTILYSFSDYDGAYPYSGVILDSSGAIFGTTTDGEGPANGGVVFKLTSSGSGYAEQIVHDYGGGSDGVSPYANLLPGAQGTLFGTTRLGGGLSNSGIVYELTPDAEAYDETILYTFGQPPDAGFPYASLILDQDGSFYGTTFGGGVASCEPFGCGAVFALKRSGSTYTETVLHDFGNSTDGANPYGSLTEAKDGTLYGTTYSGGLHGSGTVFQLEPRGTGYAERVIHSFGAANDGAFPYASVVLDGQGNLYGTTSTGGESNLGSVFELVPYGKNFAEQVVYSFQGAGDGSNPQSSLFLAPDGAFYGTTSRGGGSTHCSTWGCGTIFRLAPKGSGFTEAVLYAFGASGKDGQYPYASLTRAKTGAFYGTTWAGGAKQHGTVFKFTL